MNLEGLNGCCGINEITDLSYTLGHMKVEDYVVRISSLIMGDDGNKCRGPYTGAFLLFSGISPYKAAIRLSEFVTKEGLGVITETPGRRNPNSGNMLKCWMWSLDHRAIHRWRKGYDSSRST